MLAWLFGLNLACAVAGAIAMWHYRRLLIRQLRRNLMEQYDLSHRQLRRALNDQAGRHQIQLARLTAEMGAKATAACIQQFKLGEMSGRAQADRPSEDKHRPLSFGWLN